MCPPFDFPLRINEFSGLGVIVYGLHILYVAERFERAELFLVDVEPHYAFVGRHQHPVLVHRREVVPRFHGDFPHLYLSERRLVGVPVYQFIFSQLLVSQGVEALALLVPYHTVTRIERIAEDHLLGCVDVIDFERVSLLVCGECHSDSVARQEVGRVCHWYMGIAQDGLCLDVNQHHSVARCREQHLCVVVNELAFVHVSHQLVISFGEVRLRVVLVPPPHFLDVRAVRLCHIDDAHHSIAANGQPVLLVRCASGTQQDCKDKL